MGKVLTYILIGGAVLLGILGLVTIVNNNKSTESTTDEAVTEETTQTTDTEQMDDSVNTEEMTGENPAENTDGNADANSVKKFSTLKAAVDLGLPFKCTYTMAGVTTEGYIKGKQFKGMMVSAEGQKGQVIVKGECMWSWEEGNPQGFTMCIKPTETQKSIWDDQTAFEGVEYSCKPTIITDDAFTPPTNVEFVDMSKLLDSIPQQGQ